MKIETEEGAAILLLAMRQAFKGENASKLVAGKIVNQWDALTRDAVRLIRKEIEHEVQFNGVDPAPWMPVLNRAGW